jgi:hypothetical protein
MEAIDDGSFVVGLEVVENDVSALGLLHRCRGDI